MNKGKIHHKSHYKKGSHAELAGGALCTSASSTQTVLAWQQQRQALKALNQVQGDFMTKTTRGFTLVELLVVVLIIGILAAVALPQYNKAVRKARFSEVTSTFNAISKGIDAWLLENDGYPTDTIYFTGATNNTQLDTAFSCSFEDSTFCYTKIGRWEAHCASTACGINLDASYNADGSSGNKWLGTEGAIGWMKTPSDTTWALNASTGTYKLAICRWWKENYGPMSMLATWSCK